MFQHHYLLVMNDDMPPLQGFPADSRAYWVTRSLIAWDISDHTTSLCLYASRSATMEVSGGVVGGALGLMDAFHYTSSLILIAPKPI
jgi:hypothetical protein